MSCLAVSAISELDASLSSAGVMRWDPGAKLGGGPCTQREDFFSFQSSGGGKALMVGVNEVRFYLVFIQVVGALKPGPLGTTNLPKFFTQTTAECLRH